MSDFTGVREGLSYLHPSPPPSPSPPIPAATIQQIYLDRRNAILLYIHQFYIVG